MLVGHHSPAHPTETTLTMKRFLSAVPLLVLALAWPNAARSQQELADPAFDPRVPVPAHTKDHPRLRFDQAHHNIERIDGHYGALASLFTRDGCRVDSGLTKFNRGSLDSCDVLVVANALGAADVRSSEAGFAAFTAVECEVVGDWVRAGGALLLVADQSPYGAASESLARRFDVDMAKGYTVDEMHRDASIGDPGCILYRRVDQMIGDHAITRGRTKAEAINQIVTFTGQSLKGPKGSAPLLILRKPALDLPLSPGGKRMAVPDPLPENRMLTRDRIPAAGRSQAVAFAFGKGRVVVLGESMMFAALAVPNPRDPSGQTVTQIGMGRPDVDNRQFALNIERWLTRAMK
jgi:hypothetical protein